MSDNKQPKSIQMKGALDFSRFGLSRALPHDRECIFELRMRFNFNSKGRELLLDYWGVQDAVFAPGDPSEQINGEPVVGSVMLNKSCFQALAQFAFFRMGAVGVSFSSGFVTGIFDEELYDHLRRNNQKLVFNYGRHTLRPREGSCFR
jgi:hypothetical protein